MPFFHYEDIDFYYECQGRGYPLLFLHGLGGDFSQCRTMLANTHGFTKIYMDARAHGRSNPLGPVEKLNFGQFARDSAALLLHLDVREAMVGGISMGSATALRLALDCPKLVKALMLIRPAWLNRPNPPSLAESVIIGRLLAEHPRTEAKRIYSQRREYHQLKKTAPAVAASALGLFDVPLASQRWARLVRMPASVPFNRLEDLAGVSQETLILTTADDPAHPSFIAETIAANISHSTLATVASKSEDLQAHLRQCSERINQFLAKFRI